MASGDAWRTVWLLALVSFINDISGEMLMAVLPFLLIAQGATGLGLGLVGGMTEGVGHLFKLVGGYAGNRAGSKKLLIGSGYAVSSLSRFGVALATAWPLTLAFRSVDRVGKGLRTAPRDALLADVVEPGQRGRAFGLNRAADTAGAVVGVVAALVLLAVFDFAETDIVLVGAGIAMISLVPLMFVREPPSTAALKDPLHPVEARNPRFNRFLVVASIFHLSRVTYLFYLVRSTHAGTGIQAAVLWYLLFNVTYAALAYPAGRLSDRRNKGSFLFAGYLLTGLSAGVFIVHPTTFTMLIGFVLLGVSFAIVEGTSRAYAADLVGSKARSSRLGEYHAVTGLATLAGGIVAGLLWDGLGASAAFAWGAIVPIIAAGGLWWARDSSVPKPMSSQRQP